MGRQAWFRWVFEDGYQTIKMNYTPLEMRLDNLQHGKCINKVFVCWEGAENDVSDIH